MKGIVIVSRGIEHIAAMEINELIHSDCKIEESCVIFDLKKLSDLCLLCYKSQSADRIMYLIDSFNFSGFSNELENSIKKTKFDRWLTKLKKFKVECIRIGSHNFKSIDVAKKFVRLTKKYKKDFKFDNVDYKIIFLIYIIDNKCYFGIDFAGFELNKRGYKIYLHPNSCRGTIAYALLRESGFKSNEVLLDPFSRDGVIPIEAALYTLNFPVNYYKKDKFAFLKFLDLDFNKFFADIDKRIKYTKTKIYTYDHLFKYVDYSRKNAKIAGIDKQLNFSRVELEWLDIKFKKESVDKIVTRLPESKNTAIEKIYNEFFYQLEYILKRNGIIALISRIPDVVKQYASKHNFAAAEEKSIWSGSEELKILIIKKKNI